ncbi:hypothetical protein ABFS82_10G162400 [Erythranthe guttata]
MEDLTRRGTVGEMNFASRRAEEASLRRYQAVHWLDYLVGPLGIQSQPSEKEFISCLRNGLVLCNVINKVQPGSVPKVIENTLLSPSLPWDSQPLPAYQYFENLRNFLMAAEDMKLPIFDASVFERENLEVGSSTKVVDCILALKAFHEWKQMTGGNGVYKPPRSPIVNSAGRIHARTPLLVSRDTSRKLDLSGERNKEMPSANDIRKLEDKIVKALAEHMVETKENLDNNLVASYHSGRMDSVNIFSKILSSCFEEQFRRKFPEMKLSILENLRERSCSPVRSTFLPLTDLLNLENRKCCRACLKKGSCNHWNLVEQQETELINIKQLLSSAKKEVESLRFQLQSDLKQLGDQVLEMSTAALGYHKAVKENRNLYNMVQDLKGNIRVYCRIRPVFSSKVQNVVDFIGKDGSLVVMDPNPLKDAKRIFQFNRVFGPTATQDEVFVDTQPLVRSVMDGYNVCVFAYGQTGSGKTHTMYGPPGGSVSEMGISYLALSDLFEMCEQRKGVTTYEIQVQMVEIYNEQVRDLLAEDSCTKKLEIRTCVSDDSLALPEATLRPVQSATDVINLMRLGEINRAVGSTAINITSSRSHSILSVHVHGEDSSGSKLRSCLHLVDLAGSERVDKSEVTGDGLREAQHINKSLACLIDVMTALSQKQSHIPYRNSKLTLLLQNSLGGNAKTLMFAHVNPEGDSFGETMSTLKFAQRVSTVELGAARANKESNEVLELKAEIESLKKALVNNKEIIQSPTTKKTAEKTPPRTRRLSIENGNRGAKTPSGKPKPLITERTPPPRARRLSIENGACMEKKGAKTPSEKPKPLIPERTPPPRSRRLSIENGNNACMEKKGAKTPPTHSRRLSLEGGQDPPNSLLDQSNRRAPPRSPINSTLKSPVVRIDDSAVKKVPSFSELSNQRGPKSPINSAPKSPLVKIIDTALIQIPKTPDPQIRLRNEIQRAGPLIEIETPLSNHVKGTSHIRKSLRTIGKLINGSEKRKQIEATTPLNGNIVHDPKSPISTNARALRRQSITGGMQLPERSRRSSLGGVPTDAYGNENRNTKTPPTDQVRVSSTKFAKRWL